MSRPRRNIKFNDFLIGEIQEWLDLEATIIELQERYYNPEISEYIEGQNNCANCVIESLAKLLKLKGKPDMKQIEEEYAYYANKPRFPKSNEYSVKAKYRRSEDD